MKRAFLTLAVLALGVSAVAAQDPIAARKDLMKAIGKETASGARMLKGEAPFNLDQAKAIFKAYEDAAAKGVALFPDTSKTGGYTEPLPAIWEKKADFDAQFAKLGADGKAGAGVTDLDSFKVAFAAATKNCGGCHQAYRMKK